MDTLVNSDLGGYRLVELIRRGGMATVYKAYQPSLNRFVAVKVLEHHHDRQFVARFKAEAQIVGQLQHPNILQVYDYGEQDGLLYLATQYVEHGASLADLAKPIPPLAARPLMERLLAALEYAHIRGIVHRDVKPSNVLLPAPDWPLLADFGIAKLLDAAGPEMTAAGQVVGTAAYMAPEQAAGEPVDARTDLYAAGVVLYELVTGQPPFGAGPRSQVLARHISEPPPPPRSINPELPAAVEPILQRALAKRPDERYQSAKAMAQDLGRIAGREGRSVERPTTMATQLATTAAAASLRSPSWTVAALTLALLVLLLGAASFSAWRGAGAPPETTPETAPGAGGQPAPPAADPNVEAVGLVVWRDKLRWNDLVHIEVQGLPPPEAGQVYAAWLDGGEKSRALGTLEAGLDNMLAITYVAEDGENLLAAYDQVIVTRVPEAAATTEMANVVLAGQLPSEALVHIRHLLVRFEGAPEQRGLALGLVRETEEIWGRAESLAEAYPSGDLKVVRRHAEQLINTIEGEQGEHFGDSDGNGRVQNPGDGFGILENGEQPGYLAGVVGHAALAAAAPDANEAIKSHAAAIETIGGAVGERVGAIRDHALHILQADSIEQTEQDVAAIRVLARQAALGANGEYRGQLEQPPEEGGVLSAYLRAQLMADTPLAPPDGS